MGPRNRQKWRGRGGGDPPVPLPCFSAGYLAQGTNEDAKEEVEGIPRASPLPLCWLPGFWDILGY